MRTELPSFEDIDDTKKELQFNIVFPNGLLIIVTHFGVEKTENIARSFRACNHNRARQYIS